MEDNKPVTAPPGEPLPAEQASQVSGGDGTCSTGTVDIGIYNGPPGGVGPALIDTYNGVVDATSYVIETVANATK